MTTPPDQEPTARIDSDARRQLRVRGHEAQFAPGTIIAGRYRISSILGSGGMGEVYRADDIKLGQAVALKFLPARLARDGTLLERLHDEVRLGRQIAHPNVCRIYDILDWENAHFVSMEYVDGEDLSRLLRRIGRLAHDKAVDIARGIAAGLYAAHGKGILHRDLKPANIMIDSHGEARIMDFGLALAAGDESQDGVIAGTPAYMAPEQVAGAPATIQSDLYALGLVMYELFTGKRAHSGKTLGERAHEQSSEITTPSSVIHDIDPVVERIILRCLEQNPAHRPRSARDVIDALPGGDPLAAAMAAGETPSPRMIAAAGTEGTLKPAVAVALLGAIVALFGALFFLMYRGRLLTIIHMDKPPEVQAERASTTLRQLGIPAQEFRSYGIQEKERYSAWVHLHDFANRRQRYGRGLPVYSFWVREQSQPLQVLPPSIPRPLLDTPPQALPGAATIEVDPRGRLVMLRAIAAPSWKAQPLDWKPLFAAAGLNPATFAATAPFAVPVSMADARAAWKGKHPEDGTPIRIEAAAWRGVPVHFQIIAPWDEVDETGRAPFGGTGFFTFLTIMFGATVIGGIVLARRNLRLRRGDRQGAWRVAMVVFFLELISNLGVAEHRLDVQYELELVFTAAAVALLLAATIGLLYIAIEPVIRRRWPDRLISWTRLIGGQWRDPMVGRDVLIGLTLGMLHVVLATLGDQIPSGQVPALAHLGWFWVWTLGALESGIVTGLALMFLLVVLTFLLRKRVLAAAGIGVIWFTAYSFASHEPELLAIFAALATLYAIVVGRFGLLATVAFQLVFSALFFNPFPDAMAWYTARGLIAPLFILAVALWAFRTSLGEQKLLATDEL